MTYITFLSNYDKLNFPNNEAGSFTNTMAQTIHLDEGTKYEIALAELSYNSNRVIESDDISFELFDWEHQNADKTWGALIDMKLSHQIINNSVDLCSVMNAMIWNTVSRFNEKKHKFFTYEENRRIWCTMIPESRLTLILRARLLIMLGATKQDKTRDILVVGDTKPSDYYLSKDGEKRYFKDKREFDSALTGRDFFLYRPRLGLGEEILIYSDLCKPTHLATSLVQLLRILPFSKNPNSASENERVVVTFGSDRIYVPLKAQSCIKAGTFHIRTLNQESLMLKGYVRILVHVRRSLR